MKLQYTSFLSILDSDIKINLDQTKQTQDKDCSLITHAHSDHIVNTPQQAFASSETISIIKNIFPKNNFSFNDLAYGKKIKLSDNLFVTPLNAGHILGSTMYFFEGDGETLLYTGDFNPNTSLLLKGAEPVHADILVIESTFGRPNFSFPDLFETYDTLVKKIKYDLANNNFIVFGGYSLGKNQELIFFINNFFKEKPIVDPKTFSYSEVYKKYGYSLDYELLDGNLRDNNFLVLPISLVNKALVHTLSLQLDRNVSAYVFTGWNYTRGVNNVPISAHGDYRSLLNFVSQVNPKQVYTVHGFAREFAHSVEKELGINAKSLQELSQRTILDF
ncbi:MAG TPA: MBL fold metallo-hydrolase [archaeon]|nr:MBL fold metallo-hydrolase [archaeon]